MDLEVGMKRKRVEAIVAAVRIEALGPARADFKLLRSSNHNCIY